MKYILMLSFFFLGCTKRPTYKELIDDAIYYVGDVIIVNRGFYKGCKLQISQVTVNEYGTQLEYIGNSNNCLPLHRVRTLDEYIYGY